MGAPTKSAKPAPDASPDAAEAAAPAAAPAPRRVRSVPAKSAGQVAAEDLARSVRAARKGVSPEALAAEEDPTEDWEQDAETSARPSADARLAGVYRVVHGAVWFNQNKVVRTGRKVRLSAEDARLLIEQELVVRVGD